MATWDGDRAILMEWEWAIPWTCVVAVSAGTLPGQPLGHVASATVGSADGNPNAVGIMVAAKVAAKVAIKVAATVATAAESSNYP